MTSAGSYLDPLWTNLAVTAGRKYGLPEGLLPSVVVNGERTDPGRSNSLGTYSPFQITRATRDLVVKQGWSDPHASPQNAADTAARLIRESMDRHGGDPGAGVLEYIAGTNAKNVGPVSRAYHARVMAGLPTPAPAPAPVAHAADAPDINWDAVPDAPSGPAPAASAAPDIDWDSVPAAAPAPKAPAPVPPPPASADRIGSKGERFGLGLADLYLGGAQKLAHLSEAAEGPFRDSQNAIRGWLGAKPLPPMDTEGPLSTQQLMRSVDDQIDANARVKPAGGGFDWLRLGGNVAGGVPLLAIPGAQAEAGAGLGSVAGSGALAGLAAGAAAPVENGKDGILGRTSGNALAGAAGGAVLAPLGNLVGGVVGKGINAVVNRVRAGMTGMTSPAARDAAIVSALHAEGIDPATLGPEIRSYLDGLVGQAMRGGRAVDAPQLAAVADARAAGIALTPGQLARDGRFSDEVNLSRMKGGEDLGKLFDQQRATLAGILPSLERRIVPGGVPESPEAAGRGAIDALRAADVPRLAPITQAYQHAESLPGAHAPFLPPETVAREVSNDLGGASYGLPGDLRKPLAAMAGGRPDPYSLVARQPPPLPLGTPGKAPNNSTLSDLWQLQRHGNSLYADATGVERAAINTVHATTKRLQQGGDPVAVAAYEKANGLAAPRLDEIARVPGLAAALKEHPDYPGFVQRQVLGADSTELAGLKAALLRDAPEQWDRLRAQAMANIIGKGVKQGNPGESSVKVDSLKRAWGSISPEERDVLFTKAEQADVDRTIRVADRVQTYPNNHGINTSRTAIVQGNAILGLMDKLKAVPYLGRAVSGAAAPIRSVVTGIQAAGPARGAGVADISTAAPGLLDFLPATTAGDLIRRSARAAPVLTRAGGTVAAGRN